jgi:peptidoglycan/LPS O-acetylase OafA/YrhL
MAMPASAAVVAPEVCAAVPFGKSQGSVLLDAIRGIAAVLVTFEHLCYRLSFAYPEHPRHPWLVHFVFVMTELGHPAVIVFFVLSGFLVGGSLLRTDHNDTWTWKNYLTHRLVRLWIVLIPALLIGLAWDSASIHIAHSRINPPFVDERAAQTAASLGILTFLGNLGFVQNWVVPVFGSNGPLWSLRNEFWYYIMFPLGYFAVLPRYKPAVRVAFACMLAFLFYSLGRGLDLYAPLWLFGAMIYYSATPRLSERARRTAIALYLVVFFGLVLISHRLPMLSDYLLAAFTALLVWVALSARSAADPRSLATRGFRLLARFSYTLYLVHVPIFTFFGILLVREEHWQPTAGHVAIAGALWVGVVLFALLVASVTEFRTDTVRRRIEGWLRPRRALHQPEAV